jgi:cell division protein ZapB
LTTQDFSNYIAAMDQDLTALEDRVRQVAELCQRLRAENSDLRQRMAQLTSHNKQLAEKIDGARVRLQGLLGQLPE